MAAELEVELGLEDKKFNQDLDKTVKRAERKGKRLGESIAAPVSKGLGSVGTIAKGFVLGTAFVELIKLPARLASAFKVSIDAAQRQEAAINQLNAALRRSGDFSTRASQEFQSLAGDIQNTSIFGDELILEQLAYAKALGLTKRQTEDVVKAATNLAAGLNIDLNSAVRNISKTFSGLQGELGEQLPALRQLTAEQLRAGEAITVINRQFSGAAAAQVDTFSGSIAQLKNNFGDFTESLGFFITESETVRGSIKSISDFFGELALRVKPTKSLGDQVKLLTIDLKKLSEEIADKEAFLERNKQIDSQTIAMKRSLRDQQAEYDKLNARLFILKQEQEQNDIFSPIAKSAANARKLTTQELEQLRGQVKFLGLSVQQQEELRLKDNLALIEQAAKNEVFAEAEKLRRISQLQADFDIKQDARRMAEEQKAAAAREKRNQEILNAQFSFESFANNSETIWEQTAKKFRVTNGQIAESLVRGIGVGAGNAFAAFGRAIVTGENALKAFADALFQSISSQAVALGTNYILSGTAMLFSPNPKDQAQAPFLIKSGAALAAFGGALGATAGGGAGQSSPSAGQGVGGAAFQPDTDLRTDLVTEEREDPQTRVNVTIQGDVFDSEETGLRISKILENASLNENVKVFGGIA